jgi:putative ABC transport system ATP-binding protein
MNCASSPLSARGLTKAFTSGTVTTPVLAGLDFDTGAGDLTLICGPSGCGKSTLLAILSGLLRPDSGAVTALGTALQRCSDSQLDAFRRKHSSFIFQSFHLFAALTALDQVLLPLQYLGIRGARAQDIARAALAEVDMDHRLHHRPAQLSGGEKQRVAIARALAKRPTLLFADEPTSALDKQNGIIVIELLRRIARDHGTTVICVSHDQRLLDHADCVLQMEDGRIDRDSNAALDWVTL